MDAKRTPWADVLVAGLLPMLDALFRMGRLHPDEVYQYLEPAFHLARGFGVLAWEWQVGLRNWVVPGLLGQLLKACAAVGLTDPWWCRVVLGLPLYALHVAALAAVYRFAARRLTAPQARLALWLCALYAPWLFFAGRTMSEGLSTGFLVLALERLDARRPGPWWPFLAGVLLGLAQVTRYGSAAAILPALLYLLFTRQLLALAMTCLGGAVVALGLGWFDLVTWGGWFHSMRKYAEFNVFSGQAAANFGASPWYLYVQRLYLAPWALVGLLLWWWRPAFRSGIFLATAAGYYLAVSATAHKEARFLVPPLVLLTVAGTPAFVAWLSERWTDWRPRALAALCAAGGLAFYVVDGPYNIDRGGQFRLLVRAGREATGLLMVNEGVWGAGGYYWLGKNVPFQVCDYAEQPPFVYAMQDRAFNRVITTDDRALPELLSAGFQVLETAQNSKLLGR